MFIGAGGSKQAELNRSAKLFKEILERDGIYFALMFLADCGYNNKEIKEIAERFIPFKGNNMAKGFKQ